MPLPESTRRLRAQSLLEQLKLDQGTQGDVRREVLVALSDDQTPHPMQRLADKGHPISVAGTTSQLFAVAAKALGKPSIDRELRDYVFPDLIRAGLAVKVHIHTANEAEETGEDFGVGYHVPKSPNSAYTLTAEARELLLLDADEATWEVARDKWLGGTAQRRQQLRKKRASDAVSAAPPANKHSILIQECVDALLDSVAKDFELVYIDDADGDRINPRWEERLRELNLAPDIATRWADAMLVNERAKKIWIVDAVTSDGEVDETRAADFREQLGERGYEVAGMTTAYETWQRAAARQKGQGNLAVGTTFWIAEDGGKLFTVSSLA